jgi:hypothetical protein
VVALDIAHGDCRASTGDQPGGSRLPVANIMDYDLCAEGPWDLIVLSDTICYLGWLYSFFEIGWLASRSSPPHDGGYLLLANTLGELDKSDDILYQPWLIRTYQSLFLNRLSPEAEEIFHGTKHAAIDALISLLAKAPAAVRKA